MMVTVMYHCFPLMTTYKTKLLHKLINLRRVYQKWYHKMDILVDFNSLV